MPSKFVVLVTLFSFFLAANFGCGKGSDGDADADGDSDADGDGDSDGDTSPPPDNCTTGANDGVGGNNSPDWSLCEENQVCVFEDVTSFDDDDAPLFTCVTPTPAPPIQPGVSLASGWAPYEVESARCNNGDLARFWFRPAHDEEGELVESDDWLVFLKGGGACHSTESCAARWTTHPLFVAPPMAARWTPSEVGIFRTTDNVFATTHQVYVHYCSSDNFRGTGFRSPATGLHHDGHLIVEQVIDALETGLEFRRDADSTQMTFTLTNESRLILSGGSAGAFGTAQNLDWVADRVDATVVGLIDSFWTAKVLPAHFRPLVADYPAFSDESCAAAVSDPMSECTDMFDVAPYLETPFFAYAAVQDGLTYPYGGICVAEDMEASCTPPHVYLAGRCYETTDTVPEVAPCDHGDELNEIDPEGLACWDDLGAGERGYIAHEHAYHVSSCESELTTEGITDANGDCGAGYTCWSGHCVREDFAFQCTSSDDCPLPDDICIGSVCAHPAETSGTTPSCRNAEYTLDEDTQLCQVPVGCTTTDDCESGELCLDSWSTPYSASYRMGARRAFLDSDIAAYFVLDGRRKHTILYTDDNAFFTEFGNMRQPGASTSTRASVHDTLVEWMRNGASPATRLMQEPH